MPVPNDLSSELLNKLIMLAKHGVSDEFTTLSNEKSQEIFNYTTKEFLNDLQPLKPLYIEVREKGTEIELKLTKNALNELRSLLVDLQIVFFGYPNQIKGIVTSGLGEGQYYISHPNYSSQFQELLGWVPFPGTLNIRLATPRDVEAFQRLINSPSHLIRGFKQEERTFGEVLLWKCKIQHFRDESIDAAVIRPVRTHHNHQIVEILAEKNIRKTFNVKDEETLVIFPNLS